MFLRTKTEVPEKLNPFSMVDEQSYMDVWSKSLLKDPFERDVASMAFLVHYIYFSNDQPRLSDYYKVFFTLIRSKSPQKGLSFKTKCLCECETKRTVNKCNELPCQFRYWINQLAKKWKAETLAQLFEVQPNRGLDISSQAEHPFFWRTQKILRFFERGAVYL